MIWRPRPGQRVRLAYRPSLRESCPHGQTGRVLGAGHGPGPYNAAVELDDGRCFVVPRGHLVADGPRPQLDLWRSP